VFGFGRLRREVGEGCGDTCLENLDGDDGGMEDGLFRWLPLLLLLLLLLLLPPPFFLSESEPPSCCFFKRCWRTWRSILLLA
jgi:hypothetical protein